jgi:hypothetical protein
VSNWVQTALDQLAVDLPAGIETDMLGTQGFDASQADVVVVDVENANGANQIDAWAIYELPPGATRWSKRTDITTSSIPANGAAVVRITNHAHGRIRATATPINHVSANAHARGVWKNR